MRRFADGEQQLRGYSRLDGRAIDLAVRHAGVETDLYAIETPGVEADAAEKLIAEFEAKFAPGLESLIAGAWPPDHETRGLVANFVALQIARTRESLHTLQALTDTYAKLNCSLLTSDNIRQMLVESGEFEEVTDEDVAEYLAAIQDFDDYQVVPHPSALISDMLGLAASFVQPLADRHWSMQISEEPLYVTSDSPVMLWSEGSYPVGFLTADEVSIPIDPHHNLLMVRDGKGWPEFRISVPPRLAEQASQSLALASYEWIYCLPGSDILEKLELPTGARPLFYQGGKAVWRPGYDDADPGD